MNNTGAQTATGAIKAKESRSLLVTLLIRLAREKPLGMICGVVIVLMLLVGILADFLAPYGMGEINASHVLEAPSRQFIMGTDNIGRDIFSRVVFGARISMIVGLAAPGVMLVISLIIGVPSGFLGGKVDLLVQRFVDAWMCFPALLILLTVMSLLGPGLLQVIFVLGISGGIASSRTIRSTVIAIKENVYVQAATAVGSPTLDTLRRHIIPNIMPIVLILFTMHMAGAILAEASLSFLGYGIPPPEPSWGGMLSGPGRRFMTVAPWMVLWPGVALSVAVYCISMLGDAVRDILDPRLKGGLGRYGKAWKGTRKEEVNPA